MTEEQVKTIIRKELERFMKIDKFYLYLPVVMADGKNIKIGQGNGTIIGTSSDQKIAFHGATPVVQAVAITSPDTSGAQLKTAVDAIRNVLINKGLTA